MPSIHIQQIWASSKIEIVVALKAFDQRIDKVTPLPTSRTSVDHELSRESSFYEELGYEFRGEEQRVHC
jgi:hypothetical protein